MPSFWPFLRSLLPYRDPNSLIFRWYTEPVVGHYGHPDHFKENAMRDETVVPPGRYRVVLAGIEQKVSVASEKTYWQHTLVVLGPSHVGSILYKPCIDTDNASWVWENVLEHPSKGEGEIFNVEVRTDQYKNTLRSMPGQYRPDITKAPPFRLPVYFCINCHSFGFTDDWQEHKEHSGCEAPNFKKFTYKREDDES